MGDPATWYYNRGVRKDKIYRGKNYRFTHIMKVYSFLQLECKWHESYTVLFCMLCDLRYRSTFCVELYHLMDSTYTVWQLVQCDKSLYIFTIHYDVIWKIYISFYVICLPSYRPYNLLGREKKTLELLCMLCNLCFVSVKKVEKWVSWLLVSVEMAPSEIVLEDNSLVWRCKKIWFPGHDNLRSRATPPPPTPSSLAPIPLLYATTNIQT